jgi:hypothetical protein
MAVWRIFFKFEARQTAISGSRVLSHPTQEVQIKKIKKAQNCNYYLQRVVSVTFDWMGSIAL